MFLHLSVSHSFHMGVWHEPPWADTHPPPGQTPSQADTPRCRHLLGQTLKFIIVCYQLFLLQIQTNTYDCEETNQVPLDPYFLSIFPIQFTLILNVMQYYKLMLCLQTV